jgi:hypothetical protein
MDLARRAADCLAEAFLNCDPNTLTVREPGEIRQFAVVSGDPCILRQALQTDPSASPAVADCAGLERRSEALVFFDCSHLGDFVLPAPR